MSHDITCNPLTGELSSPDFDPSNKLPTVTVDTVIRFKLIASAAPGASFVVQVTKDGVASSELFLVSEFTVTSKTDWMEKPVKGGKGNTYEIKRKSGTGQTGMTGTITVSTGW